MSRYSFDLCSQPWLPVTSLDGRVHEVSLRDALTRGHELRALSDSSPLVTFALHRLLLAIVHRAINGPANLTEWQALWSAGRLPADHIDAYLDRWSGRFDLFHLENPFFQVGGLSTVDKHGVETPPSPVERLVVTAASGNNATLFSHDRDNQSRSRPAAVAARHLVTATATALGGGKGPVSNVFGAHPYTSHASQVGGVGVLVDGDSLAQTLLLNLLVYNDAHPHPRKNGDQPAWERSEHRPPGEVLVDGYLDYLTLPGRYVRLLPEGPSDNPEVSSAYVTPGLVLPRGEAAPRNPHWFYRRDPKKPQPYPVALRADRAVWRDSAALFALPEQPQSYDGRPGALHQAANPHLRRVLPNDMRLRVRCFGLANDKAKALCWRSEALPVSVALLDDADLVAQVAQAIDEAEDAARSLRKAFFFLAKDTLETDQKSAHQDDVNRLRDRMWSRSGFWAELDNPFLLVLDGLSEGRAQECARSWTKTVLRVATASFHRGAQSAQGSLSRRLRAETRAEVGLRKSLQPLRQRLSSHHQESSP